LSRHNKLSPAWIRSQHKFPRFWRRLVRAVDLGQQFELTYWNLAGGKERHFIEPVLVMTISGERVLGALAFNREDQTETLKVFFPHRMAHIKQTEMDLDWLKARRAAEKKALLHAIRRGPPSEYLSAEDATDTTWGRAAIARAKKREQKSAFPPDETLLNCPCKVASEGP